MTQILGQPCESQVVVDPAPAVLLALAVCSSSMLAVSAVVSLGEAPELHAAAATAFLVGYDAYMLGTAVLLASARRQDRAACTAGKVAAAAAVSCLTKLRFLAKRPGDCALTLGGAALDSCAVLEWVELAAMLAFFYYSLEGGTVAPRLRVALVYDASTI